MSNDYNYSVFVMKNEQPAFEAFPNHSGVGSRAPDATLEEASSGESVTMKSLWRDGFAIIEFGSFT